MAKAGQGDASAFAGLVHRHSAWAVGFVERLLGIRADAEDVVQQAFLRVWQNAEDWQPNAKFRTWFYQILYRLAVDQIRVRRRQPGFEELDEQAHAHPDDPASHWQQQRQGADIRAALMSLPERQRTALVLCHYQGLSQKEAAALLAVNEGALESLLSRARAGLRQRLTEYRR